MEAEHHHRCYFNGATGLDLVIDCNIDKSIKNISVPVAKKKGL